MTHRILRTCLLACSAVLASATLAQPPSSPPPGAAPPAPRQEAEERAQSLPPLPGRQMIDIEAVTKRLAREVGKDFAVDPRVRGLGGSITADAIDYSSFISLMRVHAISVIEGDDVIYVVPDALARVFATTIVQRDDGNVHPATIVTRVITTSAEATQMLGVLRPLADLTAAMSVFPPNKIVVTDRYDNVKRITEVVRLLEQR